MYEPISQSIGKLFAIHDQLVKEVELLGFGLLANIVLFRVLLYELLHHLSIKLKAILFKLFDQSLLQLGNHLH